VEGLSEDEEISLVSIAVDFASPRRSTSHWKDYFFVEDPASAGVAASPFLSKAPKIAAALSSPVP
jgi:hypothetical protein